MMMTMTWWHVAIDDALTVEWWWICWYAKCWSGCDGVNASILCWCFVDAMVFMRTLVSLMMISTLSWCYSFMMCDVFDGNDSDDLDENQARMHLDSVRARMHLVTSETSLELYPCRNVGSWRVLDPSRSFTCWDHHYFNFYHHDQHHHDHHQYQHCGSSSDPAGSEPGMGQSESTVKAHEDLSEWQRMVN